MQAEKEGKAEVVEVAEVEVKKKSRNSSPSLVVDKS